MKTKFKIFESEQKEEQIFHFMKHIETIAKSFGLVLSGVKHSNVNYSITASNLSKHKKIYDISYLSNKILSEMILFSCEDDLKYFIIKEEQDIYEKLIAIFKIISKYNEIKYAPSFGNLVEEFVCVINTSKIPNIIKDISIESIELEINSSKFGL